MRPFRLYLYNLIVRLLPETRFFRFKVAFLRWCGATVGQNVRICSSAKIQGNGQLIIGNDIWIAAGVWVTSTSPATIRIGSHSSVGPQVMIFTGTHDMDLSPDAPCREGKGKSLDVTLEEGAWVCSRSMIQPGVLVGKRSVVSANAVVTKDVPAEHFVEGNPAVVRYSIEKFVGRHSHQQTHQENAQ